MVGGFNGYQAKKRSITFDQLLRLFCGYIIKLKCAQFLIVQPGVAEIETYKIRGHLKSVNLYLCISAYLFKIGDIVILN